MKRILAISAVLVALSVTSRAQDWPQFGGPLRNGHSPETGLLRSWPEGGPEVLWSVNLGIGFGGPVIKDGKVYLLDRDDETGDIMRCLDLANGKEEWRYSYDAPGSVMFPGSRSVPVADGDKVFSIGPYGDVYCFDVNAHKPLWHKNIWKDYGGGRIPQWAISQCPLVYGNLLVAASQAPGAGVVAYDKNTGEEVWKTPMIGLTGYASPNIVRISGEDHIVMVSASPGGPGGGGSGKGHVYGIEPASGKVLWDYDGWQCRIPCGMATDCGENRVLAVGGYDLGALMLQVEKKPDNSYAVKELFRTTEFGDQTKPAIYHDGFVYGLYRTNSKRDGLVCMDLEGNIKWKTSRNPDFERGSIVVCDGLFLVSDGGSNLYLVEPDGEKFKMLSSAKLLSEDLPQQGGAQGGAPARRSSVASSQNWAPMALSGGKLLLRDQSHMICVKVAKD